MAELPDMTTVEDAYPHIRRRTTTRHGWKIIREPRTRVAMLVADYLSAGWSAEEIVRHAEVAAAPAITGFDRLRDAAG